MKKDWMIKESELDDDQITVLMGTLKKSCIVAGCAGSGKSILALIKAQRIQKECGEEVYVPFRGDVVKISGRASEIQPSNIPEVSVEMEMEEQLKGFDSEYRLLRRKVLQLVVRQPKTMEPLLKAISKGFSYMKKLFAPFNI